MEKMFEKAVRTKLRFPYKGVCTVEDLWDLTPAVLDEMYKKLRKEQKEQEEDSLLETKTSTGKMKLALQVDLVKYIVQIKVDEADARKLAADKRAQKSRIMEIMAKKQDESLEGKSMEELEKLMNDL